MNVAKLDHAKLKRKIAGEQAVNHCRYASYRRRGRRHSASFPKQPTNDKRIDVGNCKVCKTGQLQIHTNGDKRYCRCTNYKSCHTSYPLPGKQHELSYVGIHDTCDAPFFKVDDRWLLCLECGRI